MATRLPSFVPPQPAPADAGEALGLLDVIFEHVPVGLALLDTELRYVRVNELLAEINGVPAADHIGLTIRQVLPDLSPSVAADVARVAQTGIPLSEVEVSGETPARPGVPRHWLASYWPVRHAGSSEISGVGIVVMEVTERRAAERALREQTDRYESLLEALSEVGEGMVVLEQQGHCSYANPAFEQLCGYTFPELAAMDSVLDLVVEGEREEARRRAWLRAERGLVDRGYRVAMRRRDGERVELEVAGVPLELDPPNRTQLVVVVRDVTARVKAEQERERALARSALLAEASELFDQSLDEERTMRSVARLCVRELADNCVILLGDSPAQVRRVTAVAHEQERERALLVALLRDPVEERPDHPMLAVMRHGRSQVAETDLGRTAIVPLRARGRVHGVLAAGFDELDRAEHDELLALFEDLGRRAALALDNARLYEERDHVARTLQRSLLPAELPEIPGVALAARYLAAGAGNEVGGDFYDCFATGGGDWAIVIGDVCGKGAEAAAITALARYTLRAAVLHTRRPRDVLGALNEALLRQNLDYRFCTVLYASLTPRDGHVTATIATGGHPLPLVLRANGDVDRAGRRGTLLGVLAAPEISEESVDLAPGDALVLFTDGVTEASRSDRPGRLTELLASCAGRDAATIAETFEREALTAQDGSPRDDVAVLVARVDEGGAAPFAATDQGVAAAQ